MKRLTPYDIENIEKLKHTFRPYATRIAAIMADENVSKVDGYRALVDGFIGLQDVVDAMTEELIQYRMRYGSLK